jgi:hypothetical protein
MIDPLCYDSNTSDDQPIPKSGLPYLFQMLSLPSLMSAAQRALHSSTFIIYTALRAFKFFRSAETMLQSKSPLHQSFSGPSHVTAYETQVTDAQTNDTAAVDADSEIGASQLPPEDLHLILGGGKPDPNSGAVFLEEVETMPWEAFHQRSSVIGPEQFAKIHEADLEIEFTAISTESADATDILHASSVTPPKAESISEMHSVILADNPHSASRSLNQAQPHCQESNSCCITRNLKFLPTPVCELYEQPANSREGVKAQRLLPPARTDVALNFEGNKEVSSSGKQWMPRSWYLPWARSHVAHVKATTVQDLVLLLALLACIAALLLYLLELSTSRRLRLQLKTAATELARLRRLQLEERQLDQVAKAAEGEAHRRELQEGSAKCELHMEQVCGLW